MCEERGTLKADEYHPSATSALEFLNELTLSDKMAWLDAFSSCAIEGNRLAEVCSETLNRVMKGQHVSDRYVLGLAWAIKKGTKTQCVTRDSDTHDKKEE